jgi:hypothetical protein
MEISFCFLGLAIDFETFLEKAGTVAKGKSEVTSSINISFLEGLDFIQTYHTYNLVFSYFHFSTGLFIFFWG